MGIQIALRHRTDYRYDKAVSLGPQIIRLRPALHCRTPILSYSLDVIPSEHSISWQLDPSSNQQARVLFSKKTDLFAVDVNLVADLAPINPFDFLLEPAVEQYPFRYGPDVAKDLHPYLLFDPPGHLLLKFVEGCRSQRIGTVDLLLLLNRKVRDEIDYITRLEHGIQTPEETLEKRSGSCRDSAWLLVESLRNLGIAARFVSGYLWCRRLDARAHPQPHHAHPARDAAHRRAAFDLHRRAAGGDPRDCTSILGRGHPPHRRAARRPAA